MVLQPGTALQLVLDAHANDPDVLRAMYPSVPSSVLVQRVHTTKAPAVRPDLCTSTFFAWNFSVQAILAFAAKSVLLWVFSCVSDSQQPKVWHRNIALDQRRLALN